MDVLGVVQSVVAVAGAMAGFLLALKVHRAASAIASLPLRLLSVAFVVFSIALIMDSIAPLLSWHPHGHAARGVGAGRRPEEVSFLLVNRAYMLAQPLYMIAYTLYITSIYSSHAPVEDRLYAVPLLALVYMDYNIAALILLALAGYMVYTRGTVGLRWLTFYVLLAASHVLAVVAVLSTSSAVLALSSLLRSLAPIILLVATSASVSPPGTLARCSSCEAG